MATEAARGASRTDGEGATAGRAGSSDLVDRFQADWLAVRPDLDVAPMGVIGRLLRAAPLILAASETYLRPLDLTRAEFDIVSALCRSARPLSLDPPMGRGSLVDLGRDGGGGSRVCGVRRSARLFH
ncbi:hypothetical protein [Cellulomonas fimi]|uniref:hypothetical protein n=1 Tax=Cellulomonas fimi TaxID=1708 RepID=UPI0020118369|nr:hypothetical protein [Cellulomonas fimi]